jgi:hypothetical protein
VNPLNSLISRYFLFMALVTLASPKAFGGSGDTASTQPAGPAPVAPTDSILSEYTPQAPPNPNTPPYTMLRFNENYSYLDNPSNRTDLFDPLKYIPLNPSDPNSYVSFGGSIRERFEHYTGPGFGLPGLPKQDDYLLQRITLDADFHINDNLRVFAQGISGLQLGGNQTATPINNDPVDLQQIFADLRFDVKDAKDPEYLVIRGGRFEMSLGAGRLVATRAAPNVPFKFDGLEVIAAADDAHLYAFVTKPAREKRYEIADEFPDQLFWGVYATTPVVLSSLNIRADIYYLGMKTDDAAYATGRGIEERHTFGTRLFGKANGFDYDVEPILQTGRLGDRPVLAWTVGSSAGYTFDMPWHPRLGIDADIASGDTGHNGGGTVGTFNPLYFKAGYFNDASLIRPSNIIDIHPVLQFEPIKSVLVTAGSDTLWRYTTNDGIYGPGGNLELPARNGSHYLSTTAELGVQWQINRHLSWTASYVHLFTGSYVANSRGHDVDYIGSWLEFTW